MDFKSLLFSFAFLLTINLAFGQINSDTHFETFVEQQNGFFVEAYKKQDVEWYNSLLKEFLIKFEVLTKDQQNQFISYYINAYYNLCCTYSLAEEYALGLEQPGKSRSFRIFQLYAYY